MLLNYSQRDEAKFGTQSVGGQQDAEASCLFHGRRVVMALRDLVSLSYNFTAMKLRILFAGEFKEIELVFDDRLNSAILNKLLVLEDERN